MLHEERVPLAVPHELPRFRMGVLCRSRHLGGTCRCRDGGHCRDGAPSATRRNRAPEGQAHFPPAAYEALLAALAEGDAPS